MNFPKWLAIRAEVMFALQTGRPVVALESTLISHGLPWPTNLDTALAAEQAVRDAGAIPATIGIVDGQPTIGLHEDQLRLFATQTGIRKASRRDIALAMTDDAHAATTVAGTMYLAHQAGIQLFATGGIGGVHRDTPHAQLDISADLTELARTPVLVVCAGAKSILDLPRTVEVLETLSIPVIGYRTDELPGFYVRNTGLPVSARIDTSEEIARWWKLQRTLQLDGGLVCQPIAEKFAINETDFAQWLAVAEQNAITANVRGAASTPYILKEIARLSQGQTLIANQALIIANARLAAKIAVWLGKTDLNSLET